MKRFALLPEEDRKEVIQSVSSSMGLRADIIEKDFWVCFMLNYLFHRCEWKNNIAFKGGTSFYSARN
jgi:predicted nucleotidyltransferase component of viral defense system